MGRIRTLLAASILLLSGQVNAQIISSATLLEGAELWNYSVEGSVTDDQGSSSDIFGAMLIDTTARSWLYPPHAPWDGQYTATNFFHIVGFGLRIGDQNYFGGGPFINGGENSNVNALYLGDNLSVVDYPNDSGCGGCDWGFMPFGRDEIWSSGGQTFGFGYADGSPFTVSDLARGVAPDYFTLDTGYILDGFDSENFLEARVSMTLTRVARVPEPSIIALFGLGFVGLGLARRKQKEDSSPVTS